MATKYWVGGAVGFETDWNQSDNWSLSSGGAGGVGIPDSSDDVIIDAGGAVKYDCTTTVDAYCKTYTSTIGYVNRLTFGPYFLRVYGTMTLGNTGPITMTGHPTISIEADGDFFILNTFNSLTSVTADQPDLYMKGNGVHNNDQRSVFLVFRNVSMAYNGKTSIINGILSIYYSGVFTLQSGGTLSLFPWAPPTSIAFVFLGGYGVIEPFIQDGATIISNSTAIFYITPGNFGDSVITLNEFNGTNLGLEIRNAGVRSVTYDINVPLNLNLFKLLAANNASGPFIINTHSNPINAQIIDIDLDTGTNTSTFILNVDNNTITTGSITSSKDAGVTSSLNINGSIINVSGNFNLSGISSLNYEDSTLNILSDSTVTSNNNKLNYITMDSTGYGLILSDSIDCTSLEIQGGNFNGNSKSITVSKEFVTNGDGNLFINGPLNVKGLFEVNRTSGTIDMTNCSLTLQGDTTVDIGNRTISRLNLYGGGDYAFGSDETLSVANFSSSDFSGTVGNPVTIHSTIPGSQWYLNLPYNSNVSYVNVSDSNAQPNVVYAINGTNIDSENNNGWRFKKGKYILSSS